MTSAADLHAGIQRLPGVTGTAVWKIGEIPTGNLGGTWRLYWPRTSLGQHRNDGASG